jgi:hypothetical protein
LPVVNITQVALVNAVLVQVERIASAVESVFLNVFTSLTHVFSCGGVQV